MNLHVGPLEEQPDLLTAEQSLQPSGLEIFKVLEVIPISVQSTEAKVRSLACAMESSQATNIF